MSLADYPHDADVEVVDEFDGVVEVHTTSFDELRCAWEARSGSGTKCPRDNWNRMFQPLGIQSRNQKQSFMRPLMSLAANPHDADVEAVESRKGLRPTRWGGGFMETPYLLPISLLRGATWRF